MKISKIVNLPELQFLEWCQQTYQMDEKSIQAIDHGFFEKGILSLKKRRQYVLLFIECLRKHNSAHLQVEELVEKLDEFWFEIGMKKLLSI